MPFISINHKLLVLFPMLFIFAACVSTQVMPETMRAAAKETLARGYTLSNSQT